MANLAMYTVIEPVEETFSPIADAILERLGDMVPAYESVYQAFLDIEKKRFAGEGPGWEPLQPSTVAQRERMGLGGDHPILDRSGAPGGGALKDSLTEQGHKDAVFKPEFDGVFMGTSSSIAKYHQDGTDRMTARPMVDMTDAHAAIFAGIIDDYLIDGFAASSAAGGVLYAAGSLGL